jgi:CRP/FNR family cyclic AMP-dependent transcriptional regulator
MTVQHMISPEVLRRYPFFQGAGEESLRRLAMNSQVLSFDTGQTLFRDNEPAQHLYLVTEGEVDIQYVLGSGERRTADTRVSGDLLLWSAIIKPYRTTAYALARRPTQVVAIDAGTLRRLCEEDRELERVLMKEVAQVISERLSAARVQLATRG